jgi:hypothetical protein
LKSIITVDRPLAFKNKGLHLTQSSFPNQTPKPCDKTN